MQSHTSGEARRKKIHTYFAEPPLVILPTNPPHIQVPDVSHLLLWKPDLHAKDDYSGPGALAKYDDTSLPLVLKVFIRQTSLQLFFTLFATRSLKTARRRLGRVETKKTLRAVRLQKEPLRISESVSLQKKKKKKPVY